MGRRAQEPCDALRVLGAGGHEWQVVPGQRAKQPNYMRLKGGEVFGFAGLYTERDDPESGLRIPSCAIITTEPNELVRRIHDRMAVKNSLAQKTTGEFARATTG